MVWGLLPLLATSTVSVAAQGNKVNRPPNIILIMADDLGYGELGCYGQTKIRTPNIDRLAAEGMRFTRFYSASTVCAPTRCCLLTGKHTGHAAIRGNKEVGGWGLNEGEGQAPLPASETTIAEILKGQGYATACVGKWGLGGPGSEGHPLRQGFDFFFGYLCQRQAHNYTPTHLWRNHDVYLLDKNQYFNAHQRLAAPPADASAFDIYMGPQYAPAITHEQAESFVRENRSKPFFLYYSTTLPHGALQVPNEWVDKYPRDWDPEPYLGQNSYLPNLRPRASYAAMVSYLDDCVGRLAKLVDELGLTGDTLFVFKADNGTAPNAGVDRSFFNSLGGLRGMKTNLYEGGIRVPFIARWKGVIPPGTTADGLWASFDLFPTLAELSWAKVRNTVDGISIASLLRGQTQRRKHDFLYFEYPEGPQQQAIISGSYKWIRPDLKANPDKEELFDLSADANEQRDLSSSRPDVAARLRAIAAREHRPSVAFPIAALDTRSEISRDDPILMHNARRSKVEPHTPWKN